jgi:hypothetical protein
VNIKKSKKNDDVMAARIATARAAKASKEELARWSMRSGPSCASEKNRWCGVAGSGRVGRFPR